MAAGGGREVGAGMPGDGHSVQKQSGSLCPGVCLLWKRSRVRWAGSASRRGEDRVVACPSVCTVSGAQVPVLQLLSMYRRGQFTPSFSLCRPLACFIWTLARSPGQALQNRPRQPLAGPTSLPPSHPHSSKQKLSSRKDPPSSLPCCLLSLSSLRSFHWARIIPVSLGGGAVWKIAGAGQVIIPVLLPTRATRRPLGESGGPELVKRPRGIGHRGLLGREWCDSIHTHTHTRLPAGVNRDIHVCTFARLEQGSLLPAEGS